MPDQFDSDPDAESTAKIPKIETGEHDSGPAHPYLMVIGGPSMGRMYRLTQNGLLLGRSVDADVIIEDDGVSRRHAQIELAEDVISVRDLGSTNGVYINGKKSKERTLVDGDRVRIGSTILKLSFQDELEENFQKQLYDSAVRDSLTGAFNKRYFNDSLKADFAFFARHNSPLSVMMIDLDHFKSVNDEFGHLAGDYVLKAVVSLLIEGLRTEDVLCRYGGEEFAVILKDIGTQEALTVAERLRKSIQSFRFSYNRERIPMTVSIGIATLKNGNFTKAIELIAEADRYLYSAKNAGRNRTACKAPHKDSERKPA